MSIKRTHSLKFKMLLSLIHGASIAVLLLLLTGGLSDFLLREYYMDPQAVEKRQTEYVEELQSFVTERGLSSTDIVQINDWVTGKRWVSLTLYKDSKLLFEYETTPPDSFPDLMDGITTPDDTSLDSPILNTAGTYSLRMADGILLATLDEHSENYARMVARLASVSLASLVFFLSILWPLNSTTRRITRLAEGVSHVEKGNLKLTLGDDVGDEISALAANVNSMRDSILEKMEKEQKAWQANTDLITAMSHDIRTPLTIMMGYLDLIRAEKDPEKIKRYAEACQENALRLKRLSDDLFHSFLVFQENVEAPDLQSYDVAILFDQIYSERAVLLAEAGLSATASVSVPDGMQVMADTGMLLRIIDNIFSNATKYADPNEAIRVSLTHENNYCILTVTNKEKHLHRLGAESTGIGLKNCEKLAVAMGGSFSFEKVKDSFLCRLSLKVKK